MSTFFTTHLSSLILSSVFFQSCMCSASRDAAAYIQRGLQKKSTPTAIVSKVLRRQDVSTATIIENGSTITSVVTSEVVVTVSPSSAPPVVVSTTITSSPTPTSDSASSSSSDSSTSSSTPSSSQTQNSSTGTISQAPTPTCSSGYFLCDPVFNGGCCRLGFTCTSNACIAPSSITDTRSCGAGSFLCPAAVSYGCCPAGYQCDLTACLPATGTGSIFPTDTVPPSVSAETTATDGSSISATGVIPKGTDDNISSKIAPITPTPTSSGTSQSNNLSAATVGGIVSGVVIAVAAIAIMLYFTCRRLRQRGNLEPSMFGGFDRRHRRGGSPIPLGAPTTNAYDPNNPVSHSSDVRRTSMPEYYPVHTKTAARLPPPRLRGPMLPNVVPAVDGGFDFGFDQQRNGNDGEHTRHNGSDYQPLPSEEYDLGRGDGHDVGPNGSGGSTPQGELHQPQRERPRPSGRHVSWSTEAPG